jgi:phage terminase large subunit-like protein
LALLEDKVSRIAACEDHIWLFSLYYFTDYHRYTLPAFHYDFYNDLDGMNKTSNRTIGAVWEAFRESSKTTLAKIKLIHNVVYQKKHFNIWASFDQKKAEANLFDVALQLQTNKKLIADFGQLFYEAKSRNKKSEKKSIKEFVTTNGCKLKAYSTGQSIRGEVFGAYRPDFLVFDDIETLKTIVSEPRTNQVKDFIDEALSGMGGDCNVLCLANALSHTGSVAYIRNKVKYIPGWVTRNVPVMDENSVPTWPSKYTLTDYEAEIYNATITDGQNLKVSIESKRRLLNDMVFNREMMNIPLTDEEREFKLHWMQKTYTLDSLKDKTLNTYVMVDVADTKDRKKSIERRDPDYTGIVVVSIDTYNNWYIRYAKRERLNAPEKIDKIFWLWQTFNPIKIGVEKKAFEDEIQPYILIKGEETKVYPVVEELKHGGVQKEQRIRGALQGRFQHGKIFFLEHANDDQDKLKIELYDFPKARWDDLADSLSYCQQLGVAPYAQKNEQGVEMTDTEKEFYEVRKGNKPSAVSTLRRL